MAAQNDTEKVVDLPSPPFVAVSGIHNFRDLGGYAVSPSLSVKRNVVYRCGEPSKATQDGVETLKSLGITHTYDLRSKVEIDRNKDAAWGGIKEWDGCERVFAPIFIDQDYSPENLAFRFKDYASEGMEGFTRAYTDILESAPPSYRKILLHLANEPSKPLIIHCTAGKDRTGVICALILSICGVPDESVAYEYSLTEQGLAEFREVLIAHLLAHPALEKNEKGALNMISARAANMLATLKMIRARYGGPEQYVVDRCGLTKEDIRRIRSNLVVEAPAIHTLSSNRVGQFTVRHPNQVTPDI